jgi:hypothetical protein
MTRVGRKRKYGHREANGRLARMLAEERDRRIMSGETVTVLMQPHRRGDTSEKCESPLGRFVLRNKLREELYTTGIEYGGLVRQFYAAKGIPQPSSDGGGSGRGVSPEKAMKLKEELDRLEPPLKRSSPVGFGGLRQLTVHEQEIPLPVEPETVSVLYLLAQMLRKLGRR